MDPNLLADAPPPRYAVESDDEDEYAPVSTPAGSDQPPEIHVEFKSIYDIPSKQPLVFASAEAGVRWATIANLGEQRAGIYVNKHQVGLLFRPSWTSAVVVVSEAETRTRLPLFAMAVYTTAILARLEPTTVAILDAYPTQLYISPRAISREHAPIRYLALGKKPVPDADLALFAPPNLLQSTTASLLNALLLRAIGTDDAVGHGAAIVLLPSPKVSPPPPTTLGGKGIAGDRSDTTWDRETLGKAHRWLFAVLGENVEGSSVRAQTEPPPVSVGATRATLGEIGEGSMYI